LLLWYVTSDGVNYIIKGSAPAIWAAEKCFWCCRNRNATMIKSAIDCDFLQYQRLQCATATVTLLVASVWTLDLLLVSQFNHLSHTLGTCANIFTLTSKFTSILSFLAFLFSKHFHVIRSSLIIANMPSIAYMYFVSVSVSW